MDTPIAHAVIPEPSDMGKKRDMVTEFKKQHVQHKGLLSYRGPADMPHGTRSNAHGQETASDVTAQRIMHDASFLPVMDEAVFMVKPELTRGEVHPPAGVIQEYFKENRPVHSLPPSNEDAMVQTRPNRSEIGQLQLIQQAPPTSEVLALDNPPHEFTRNKRSAHDTPSMPGIYSPFEPAPVASSVASYETTRSKKTEHQYVYPVDDIAAVHNAPINTRDMRQGNMEGTRVKKTEKIDMHVKDTVKLTGGPVNVLDVRQGNLENTRIRKCEQPDHEAQPVADSMINAKPALASWSSQPEGTRMYKTAAACMLRDANDDSYKDIGVSAPPMDVNQFSVQARDHKLRRDGITASYNGVLSTPKIDLDASTSYSTIQVRGQDTKAQRQTEQQKRMDQFDQRKGAILAMTPVASTALQSKPSRDTIPSPLADATLSVHQYNVLDQQRKAATSNMSSATRHGRGSKNEGTKDADLKHKLGLLSIQQLPIRPFDAEAHLRAPVVTKQRDSTRGNVVSVTERFGDADNGMEDIVSQETSMMPQFTRLNDQHPLESIEHRIPVLPDWQTLIDMTREHRPNPTRLNEGRNEVDASDQIRTNIQLNMHTGPSKHMISKLVPCNSKNVVVKRNDRQPHALEDIRIARAMPSIDMENALNRNSQENAHKKLATERTAREILPSQPVASSTIEPNWDRFGQDTRSAYKVPAKYLKN